MRVLLIDDDAVLRKQVAQLLRDAGLDAEQAGTAELADDLARSYAFSAIVLDLGLPDGDGLDLLRRWRRSGIETPVLVLSARGAPDERADGLEAGANDYLAKPYHARELVARLRRLLDGARPAEVAVKLGTAGTVEFWPSSGEVTVSGQAVSLSATLRRSLDVLVAAKGRAVSKTYLLDQIADLAEGATDNAAEQWVRRLRQKLGNDVIVTEPGLGYRVSMPSAAKQG